MPNFMKSSLRLASFILPLTIACASFCTSALPARAQSNSTTTAAFPPLSAFNLAKAKLNLPSDFAAQLNLLLISFQPEQQTEIETWMPVAQALQHTNFDFRWYRMPVSASENFVFRWWDNSSMRSDETDPESYPWIVPLYVDITSFRRSLRIPTTHAISVLLVNRQGQVIWRAQGPMSPAERSSLIAAVAASR